MSEFIQFPPQQLPFSKKNKAWRKRHCDWADSKTFFNYSQVRNSVVHKKINYDLVNGRLHMSDVEFLLNPERVRANFVPDRIQHYPVLNTKLNVLRGEESRRVFDYKVVVTNPNAVTEIENAKKEEALTLLRKAIEDRGLSDEQFRQELTKIDKYLTYEWQDMREVRANALLDHYIKEYNMPLLFNQGFMDALVVAEEIYMCDIVGGEPVIERLNPNKVRVFRSGSSNKIEDADVVILEDYWSPGRIIDTFYDVLSKEDVKRIESMPNTMGEAEGTMDNVDERYGFVRADFLDKSVDSEFLFGDGIHAESSLLPYDMEGNIRVLRVFWKSRRKIKKVKYYTEDGEEDFAFYPETYVADKTLGEEEETMWVNEAWEGTKIGKDIYVNMRPRVVQYNRLSNPSRCHFGIIGSVYNLNDSRPYSYVDILKPYNYLYDIVHDRLNKIMAKNWGKIIQLDLSKVPAGWDIDKWMYYAKTNSIAVIDSFNEGNVGAATGKLAGALNNASSGVIDAELGNSIQMHINLLEYIKNEMSDTSGISRQREGTIEARETVGGVERSNLQSSYITEWLYVTHEDVKKRVLECFLETAKISIRGRSKKFQYILSDMSSKIVDVDGDQFAECDYGLVVNNSVGVQTLQQKLDMLAQAALQNSALSFSAIMKLYTSNSLSEKQRMIEENEREMMRMRQEEGQRQQQMQQQQMQAEAARADAELRLKDEMNRRDNETKIAVAQMSMAGKAVDQEGKAVEREGKAAAASRDRDERARQADEKRRQFDERLRLDRDKLAESRRKDAARQRTIQKQNK